MLSNDASQAVDRLINVLQNRNKTLSTAESCTGGLMGAAITEQPGTSAIYFGGVNAYSNELKESLLAVPKQLMIDNGTVSEPVALAMAKSIQRLSNSDYSIAITGVAGPGGGTAAKPVGLVCLAIAGKAGLETSWHIQASGERGAVRSQAVQVAAETLISLLEVEP